MRTQRMKGKRLTKLLAIFAVAAFTISGAFAVETVDLTVPGFVTFYVWDVNSLTIGSPDPCVLSFENASLTSGNALRISVTAESADFTPPSGTAIPASKVYWTTSNAAGGNGSNGTLSDTLYTQIFQSIADPTTGSLDITFKLSAPGASIRAGNHTLTMRWKAESITP
ncbi:MAG: hypothetical protein WCO51_06025 [bacterium]|jgi:hypothetical protein